MKPRKTEGKPVAFSKKQGLLRTRVFELYNHNYKNISELARAMGISAAQAYRVRQGKRSINEKFIIGAAKAFPGYKLDELFYVVKEE